MQSLLVVGDEAVLHQRDDSHREHLRVDAEILVIRQRGQNGIGNAANAYEKSDIAVLLDR